MTTLRRLSLSVCLMLAMAAPTLAARMLSWTASPADLAGGEADGIAISQQGLLFMAPRLTRLGAEELPGHPQQVWSMASDAVGNLYLGTGPTGSIIKVGSSGSRSLLLSVDEPLVTALAATSEGELLAATAPGGLIYKVRTDGGGGVWSETGERYVWSLAVGDNGLVYAGTGEKGRVLEIDRSGEASLFFDSDETHITSLLPLPDGRLLAGGAGRGLVYEIDAEGNAHVLYDGDLPQVAALAAGSQGELFAALVAPRTREPERPSVRLRLPDGVEVGNTDENIGSLEEKKGPYLRGTIEGLPGEAAGAQRMPRGSLVRIMPGGEIEEVWRSTEEAPFCLLAAGDGEALFGTGEPARLYHIAAGGDVSLLATLEEAQITGLRRIGRALFLSTSNPAASYRLEERQTDSGVYLSRPFDAGGPARWGSVRWRAEGGGNRVELYTRTGNSSDPDGTWSGWSPALTGAEGSPIVNPEGRFLQWRVRLVGSQGAGARLSSVTVSYEPYNRAPLIEHFALAEEEGAISGDAILHWTASDPDRDPVEITLRYRPARSGEWRLAPGSAILEPGAAAGRENEFVWQTSELDEGMYEIQAIATDQAANALGEGREIMSEPPLLLTIDRTPPRIEIRSTGTGGLQVMLTDHLSEIRRLELLQGSRVLHTIRAVDGMCDSRTESFRLEIPGDGEGLSLRGVDAAGNSVERALQGAENVG
jgi:hypothetical protein